MFLLRTAYRTATITALRTADVLLNRPRYLHMPATPAATAPQAGSRIDPAAADTTAYVLFGSHTGNAEYIADALTEALIGVGADAVALQLDQVTAADLPSMKTVALICSTTGEGDFPATAEAFAADLAGWSASGPDGADGPTPLSADTGYAVLALGDRNYAHFCAAGRTLDARLADLGAHRLLDRRECEAHFDADAAAWIDDLVRVIYQRLGLGHGDDLDEIGTGGLAQRPWQSATVLEKRLLSRAGSTKEVWHFQLQLDPAEVSFSPGDGIAVLPQHDPDLVAELCARLDVTPETILDGYQDPVATILSTGRELGRPGRRLIEHIAEATGSDELAAVAAHPDHELLAALDGRDTLDLLNVDPDHRWDAAGIIALIPPLTQRIYSVASSPADAAHLVDLTVAVDRWTRDDRPRGGACGTFLADRTVGGDTLTVRAVPNPSFRLPASDHTPIIMVGPGTGVAPFRGFLADRAARGARGRNWLFFGDRNRDYDYLYRDELESWLDAGHLSDLDLAFSRDQPERCYVQDLMRRRGGDLFAWLADGAYLYVCGDRSAMAGDVEQALVEIVADHGGLTGQQARAYVDRLKSTQRYLQDVY